MNLSKALLVACSIFAISCASTHPGQQGKSTSEKAKLPLKISAETIDGARGQAFQLVEVTVENTSDEWLRITHGEVVIKNPGETKLSVVTGPDLKSWAEAMAMQLKKDEYNRALLQTGLVATGAVAMAAAGDNNPNLAALGAATVVGTYAWAVSDVIAYSLKDVQTGEKVPENHLYRSFSVPGKMFLRRWVLINKPSKVYVNNLILEIETIDGEKDTYAIKL